MTNAVSHKQKKGDLKKHLHIFRLDDQQELQYREMLERSGAPTQTKFILGRIFG